MKFSSILAVLACASTAFSIPLASSNNALEERARKAKKASYKLTSPAATGKTGSYFDKNEGVTKVFFGDDLKTHAAHIQHHETKFPSHKGKTYKLASGKRDTAGTEFYKNGEQALGDLTHIPRNGKAFDEKPWASLSRESDGLVSVAKVPDKESRKEGGLSNLAKQMHKANVRNGSKGIKLIDNRTNKTPLDPSLLLKGMKRRSLLDGLKNKTESIGDDLKNKTSGFIDDIEADWASVRSKMESAVDPLLKDVEWVGDNFLGFLKQELSPEDHQLGVFWHGMDIFDDVWAYDANSTSATDRAWVANCTNLAADFASLGLHNETSSKVESTLAPYLDALVGLVDGESDGTGVDDDSDD